MTQLQAKSPHRFDVDTGLMRIVAAFFVVLLHSSEQNSVPAVFFNSISRFSVPVFIIISGYYMLTKETAGKSIVRKCLSLLLKMLSWSAIYYVYLLICDTHSYGGIQHLISFLLTEPYHLWYCYASIALYLLTPVLLVFCRSASRKEYHYALSLSFLLGSVVLILLRTALVPTLQAVVEKSKIPYTLGFIYLFLLGGYFRIHGTPKRKHRFLLYLAGVVGAGITFFGTLLMPTLGLPGDLLLSFFAPNTILMGVAFFLFCQQFHHTIPDKWKANTACVQKLSDCTLGIYFVHPLILTLMQRFPLPFILPIPLKALFAYTVSLGIVFLARHLPVIKQIV